MVLVYKLAVVIQRLAAIKKYSCFNRLKTKKLC